MPVLQAYLITKIILPQALGGSSVILLISTSFPAMAFTILVKYSRLDAPRI